MEPIITINEYPIGWEWLDKVPLEDFTWLIEIFSTNEKEYNYFLDTFTSTDKYEQIIEIYANPR